jgi:hypothetical protein
VRGGEPAEAMIHHADIENFPRGFYKKFQNFTKVILHCCRHNPLRQALFFAKLGIIDVPSDTSERFWTRYQDIAQSVYGTHVEGAK